MACFSSFVFVVASAARPPAHTRRWPCSRSSENGGPRAGATSVTASPYAPGHIAGPHTSSRRASLPGLGWLTKHFERLAELFQQRRERHDDDGAQRSILPRSRHVVTARTRSSCQTRSHFRGCYLRWLDYRGLGDACAQAAASAPPDGEWHQELFAAPVPRTWLWYLRLTKPSYASYIPRRIPASARSRDRA